MPVERRAWQPMPGVAESLVEELISEYRLGANSPNQEPRIIIDEGEIPRVLQVYVIWSRWEGMRDTERSNVIMDALEVCMRPEELAQVTLAWGLTPEEWQKISRK